MLIDWNHFTPWSSLAGGVLLGLAASLFVLLSGRILGISGIVGGLFQSKAGDVFWRLSFLAGLFAAPWVWRCFVPINFLSAPRIDASWPVLVIAGLLVGLGTRYGAGCTSGHGVCGLSRWSLRSLVATACFMAAGFFTVYLVRHLVGALS